MYIRMIKGRDRGEVKEFTFVDAQDLIKSGQALPVNFDEPDPLATRTDIEEVKTLPFVVSPQSINPPVMASKNLPKARKKL